MADDVEEPGAGRVAKARGLVKAAKTRTEEAAADARNGAYRAADKATTLMTEHPLAVAAAAVAAGAAIGMLLPRWKAGAKIGMAVGTTARRAAKTIAAAETAKMLFSGLTSAGDAVRTSAHRLAEQAPDTKAVRATAARAITRAGEAAQTAGSQAARTAQKLAKTVEIAERVKPARKTRSTRKTGED
jgi:ElaB/YqjD/DUF883 family membrane-anchored ribosome-binding protein